jgi:hypothetical protein
MMLSIWYTFMIPYRLAFISTVERWSALWVIDGSAFSIFNIIFYIDLPINFCTAVKEGSYGELKDNHRDIAVIYIQSWFLIDLVTCFPFETLTEESDGAQGANLAKSFKLIRLIKTLRILRATRVLKKILEFIQFNPNKLRLLGLLSMLVSLHRKQYNFTVRTLPFIPYEIPPSSSSLSCIGWHVCIGWLVTLKYRRESKRSIGSKPEKMTLIIFGYHHKRCSMITLPRISSSTFIPYFGLSWL